MLGLLNKNETIVLIKRVELDQLVGNDPDTKNTIGRLPNNVVVVAHATFSTKERPELEKNSIFPL